MSRCLDVEQHRLQLEITICLHFMPTLACDCLLTGLEDAAAAEAAPKTGCRASTAARAACRWPPGAVGDVRKAATRAMQRLAAECKWLFSLLRWLVRVLRNEGENTAGTCSDLCQPTKAAI